MKTVTIYERLAATLAVILLILVCGTGIWVYNRLSEIVNPDTSKKPENYRLIMLKELNSDLVRAENCLYAYALGDNDSMSRSFFRIRTQVGFRMLQLKDLASEDKDYKSYVDSLGKVVDGRFETMETMMIMRNENRVNEAMNQVLTGVKSIARNKPQTTVVKQEETVERKRLFNRKKKKEEPKVVTTTTPGAPSVNVDAVNSQLREIREDVVWDEQQKKAIKLILEQRNTDLVARYTQLVQRIEISEKKILLEKAKKAHAAAAETNMVIGFFSVISVLLIICVAYLIVRLIRKIRKANVQLRIAKEKSDHLTESKSRFLANMSHEIRTPLNAIVGFADQMNSKNMPKEDVQKLEIIRKSAEHLTQITNDVLDFSKINSGALEIEQVPLSLKEEAVFVEQNIRELVIRNGNKLFVTVGNTVPDFVLGDPLRIRQVLLNLLGNAAKFTRNGEVELNINLLETTSDSCVVRIEVRDTGIGIEPGQMERIFEEFEQAETTTTREFGGTGLGLTITRRLVQLMKGKLEVRSVPGQETVFTIQLPFVVSNDKPKPKAVTVYSDTGFLRGKRILIVDDEEYNRKLLISVLKDTGAVLSEAENGEVALEMLKQSETDVVLLDLRMPKMNGFDTRNAILKLEEPKSLIPVVALTAALSHEERIKMLEANWKGVLIKPLKKNDLLACLSGIFLGDSPVAVSETPPPSGKDNDVINLEPLKEISGSDTIFYLDMLRTLHRTTTDGLRAINQTSRLKDWEGMAEAAHKIAPPVKHIQAKEVYELLKMLERAGRSHAIDASVIESVQQLNRSMEHMLEHLKEEIDRVG